MASRKYTVGDAADGSRHVQIHARGLDVLDDPEINRGTAFTMADRDHLGLHGRLPRGLETLEEQVARSYEQFKAKGSDIERWVFLTNLHDSNEVLFYKLVGEHVHEMLPIVYTPTVGAAIEEFSHLFRRPRGLFLSIDDIDGVDRALASTGLGADDIDLIVASDAEAILGIGDWGVGGIDISIGKLAVYTVAAGIDPARVLAVGLDVGTNREQLLNDPRYLGLRHSRVRGEEYDRFIDAYVASASSRFPNAILHWEDFSGPPARGILARYGEKLCTFDDDIQGTAAVGLASVLSGVRVAGGRLVDQKIVVFGAGSAGVGIADLIALAMTEDGLTAEEAAGRIYLLDRPGLLTSDMTDLYDYQQPYAKDPDEVAGWRAADGTLGLLQVVENLHPTMLVGTSGVTGAFTEEVLRTMHQHCERPIILPMSNPTVLAEQTPAHILEWTDGQALVATGSPFGPVERNGTTYRIGQANNALMFPGLGLGVIVCRAATMPPSLFIAAARALAELADPSDPAKGLLPDISRLREVSATVAVDVINTATAAGIARVPVDDPIQAVHDAMWWPAYLPIKH
ncbi:NAD-dependent malic enzyme [Marmoricola sp. RAF53]|uniref:NAD-dependent malic enzyme n=1 Tax=Marmoricola sp. RAF53 TaxID=3233059 RepID=UPI003F9A80BC